MRFCPLEKLHRLQHGYRKGFIIQGHKLLLIHCENQTHLISERCPHAGASLANATIDGGCIRCPAHGISFDLATGRPQGGEVVSEVESLTRFALVYEGNQIGVMVNELDAEEPE